MTITSIANAEAGSSVRSKLNFKLAECINVRNAPYNATGDGVTNDYAAIQAAFDDAFGTTASPHGNSGRFTNVPVYFPAGLYKVNTTLTMRSVTGGRIFGDGANSTRLEYGGSVAGGGRTNGFSYSTVEGLNLSITGADTVCFYYGWDNTGSVPATANTFSDMLFEDATTGLLIGADGYQGDQTVILNCTFSNHSHAGAKNNNYNALLTNIIGGGGNACGTVFYSHEGSISSIIGASFGLDNTQAIRQSSGDGILIAGCRSEGVNFATLDGRAILLGNIHQHPSTNGYFVDAIGGDIFLDGNLSSKGNITGGGTIYSRGNTFTRSDYLDSSSGVVVEDVRSATTVGSLPTANARYKGQRRFVTDSNAALTAGIGAVVAAGGSNNVPVICDGSNWRIG
jgi:hypothetical protein